MKILKFFTVFLVSFFTVSCSKETLVSTSNIVSEEDSLISFSELLSRAVANEPSLRVFLKKEALLEYDNDYDVFYQWTKGEKVDGKRTFEEVLRAYDKDDILSSIVEATPLLTILIPDWSWVNENCFSVLNWNTDSPEVGVGFDKDGSHPVYYNGEVVTTLEEGSYPEFPVLIVKENERMVMRSGATKATDVTFDFADNAFNGIQTKGKGRVKETHNLPHEAAPTNYVSNSLLKGRVRYAFENGEKNTLLKHRDYIYYGMDATTSEGSINTDYTECIQKIKFTTSEIDGLYDESSSSQDYSFVSASYDRSNTGAKIRNFAFSEAEIKAKTWGEGNIELRISVAAGSETSTKILSIPFADAFTVTKVYDEREENWLGANMWRIYHIERDCLQPKWIECEDLNLFSWDLTKYPEAYFISVEEYDSSVTKETTMETTFTYATNFKYTSSKEKATKVGYEYGSSATIQKTETVRILYEEQSDQLGSFWVHYYDPVVVSQKTSTSEINIYSTGLVDFMIYPNYLK